MATRARLACRSTLSSGGPVAPSTCPLTLRPRTAPRHSPVPRVGRTSRAGSAGSTGVRRRFRGRTGNRASRSSCLTGCVLSPILRSSSPCHAGWSGQPGQQTDRGEEFPGFACCRARQTEPVGAANRESHPQRGRRQWRPALRSFDRDLHSLRTANLDRLDEVWQQSVWQRRRGRLRQPLPAATIGTPSIRRRTGLRGPAGTNRSRL